ncbi:MAG: ATP-binding protein [Pirellulaceae bacterium]|nr:MAG: ATP-binding protein [Pirellulaceae bacterium]
MRHADHSRPIPYRRLLRLLQGIDARQQRFAQQLRAHRQAVAQEKERLQTELASLVQRLESQWQERRREAIETIDAERMQAWDEAELRTYKAIRDTEDEIQRLRQETRRGIELAEEKTRQRIAELERQGQQEKEAHARVYQQLRQQVARCRQQLEAIVRQWHAMHAQLNLAPHTSQETNWVGHEALAGGDETRRMLEEIDRELEPARRLVQQVSRHPLLRLFGTAWLWALCGALLIVSFCVVYGSGWLKLLPAVAVAGGATILFLLVIVVGIRPWLRTVLRRRAPELLGAMQRIEGLCRAVEAAGQQHYQDAIERLEETRRRRGERANQWCEQRVSELRSQLTATRDRLQQYAAQQKRLAAQELDRRLAELEAAEEAQLSELELRYRADEQEAIEQTELATKQLDQQLQATDAQIRIRTQRGLATGERFLQSHQQWCQKCFPDWKKLVAAPDSWPPPVEAPVVPIGTLERSLGAGVSASSLSAELAATQSSVAPVPVLYSPLDDGGLVLHATEAPTAVGNLLKTLLLRVLTSSPAGRVQICVVDPQGLGRDFGWLMHLADYDPELVTHRVWTQPRHVARQLERLAQAAEDIIQQALRNKYRHIVEYNRDAQALAEPFRILIWRGFPAALDESAQRHLLSLMESGPKCGIFPILCLEHPTGDDDIGEAIQQAWRDWMHLHVASAAGHWQLAVNDHTRVPVGESGSVDDAVAEKLVMEVGRRAQQAARIEVPLQQVLPDHRAWQQQDSSFALEIPIGQSGVGRVHSLRLGTGTAQHAIIAGKTGSGKSSLLHALITSAVARYSPDRLRLVLLDFKKGVEFQVYADAELPHADIIGIESHREFGLSALTYVNECLQRRGELFRREGVQDITAWNQRFPHRVLPRVLVIIDEFQELFCEDDKITAEAELALDRIVRQGRSFGIHAVLASQTLGGSYSLPRTTLGQIGVRIALQCDPSDTHIIFDEDNPAASRLKHPGQAIYNDAGGRIEGNQPLQVGWLAHSAQREVLERVGHGYHNTDATTNVLGTAIVFDGSKPARWNEDAADQAIDHASSQLNPHAVWCLAGESVALRPAVVFPLTYQPGRNVLLVGNQEGPAAATLHAIMASVARRCSMGNIPFSGEVIQAARPTDQHVSSLPDLWREGRPTVAISDPRNAAEAIVRTYQRLEERQAEQTAASTLPVHLLIILNLGRIRELRRSDEFDFGNLDTETPSLSKQFEQILVEGPSHGIFTIAWADANSSVQRWLGRSLLKEFEVRLLMQMGAADANSLVDSLTAARLGAHEMLLYDEATGHQQRFRPYEIAAIPAISRWLQRCASSPLP